MVLIKNVLKDEKPFRSPSVTTSVDSGNCTNEPSPIPSVSPSNSNDNANVESMRFGKLNLTI